MTTSLNPLAEKVLALAEQGYSPRLIRRLLRITTQNERATRFRLRQRGHRIGRVSCEVFLVESALAALGEAAAARDMTVEELVAVIVTIAVRDDLIDGILDDGDPS